MLLEDIHQLEVSEESVRAELINISELKDTDNFMRVEQRIIFIH